MNSIVPPACAKPLGRWAQVGGQCERTQRNKVEDYLQFDRLKKCLKN